MSWLAAIDAVLKLPVARWGMVGAILYLSFSLLVTNKTLDKTKLNLADSALMVARQNTNIMKANKEHLEASAKLQKAVTQSKELQKDLIQKQERLLELELTGTCEEMVEQLIDEISQ